MIEAISFHAIERIDNLTDEQRKLILRKTKEDMDKIIEKAKGGEE